MAFGSSPLATASTFGANGGSTSAVDTTGAKLLVANMSWYAGVSDTNNPTLSDSKGNTWTALTQTFNTHTGERLYYCIGAVVGTGHTFTAAGTGVYVSLIVTAWSDSASGTAYDKESISSTVAASHTPGSVTPAANGSLVISGLLSSETGTVSIDGGFTISATVGFDGATNEGGTQAYLVQTTAAAVNPTWSKTGTAGVLIAAIAVFSPGVGAASSIAAISNYYRMMRSAG